MIAVAGRAGTIGVDVQRWPALGTTAVLCTDGVSGSSARAAAEREIEEIAAAASRLCENSELSRGNRAGGQWVPVSERRLEALELALRAAAVTDGAVDPTLGGNVDLGATAKALAADRGARAARLPGGAGTLPSLSGDIAPSEPAPRGGWLAAHNLPARLVTVDGAVETQGGWPR